MSFSDVIKKYDAVALNQEKLTAYEQFAFKLFHDAKIIANPSLEITVQLDITDAEDVYRKKFSKAKGASLTAYLSWCLIQTIKKYPCFTYRSIEGTWYEFKNLPLFFPVALEGKERFGEVLIENACKLDWPSFSECYRANLDRLLKHRPAYERTPFEIWHVGIFIGNLPDLQFTHLSLHVPVLHIGRPLFYFGKRYRVEDRMMIPLYCRFDHSNLDPQILGVFLKDYGDMLVK